MIDGPPVAKKSRNGRILGWLLCAASVLSGAVAWFALRNLAIVVREHTTPREELPSFAVWWAENPLIAPLLCLPGIFFAMLVLLVPRLRWVWIVCGVIALLIPVLVVVICAVMLIAPLYDVQTL